MSLKRNGPKELAAPPHDEAWLDSKWRSRVRSRLLAWFAEHKRTLPWRDDSAPYRVWVSEVMLQQTQVATVIPYFERFLETFPTIVDLAQADESLLLQHWEGLGYYRRARSMHAAAKVIADQHGGDFPTEYEQVLALPGIGRYTAGAILSISLQQRLPVLEGNTQRVFSRWVASRGVVSEKATADLLWRIAEKMLPRSKPGEFNQAAMELGALICTPKAPQCGQCPVSRYCAAHRQGAQEEIPGKVSRVRYEDRTEFAVVIQRSQGGAPKYLVRPLPDGGRWAGLWDFPRTTRESFDHLDQASAELEKDLGVPIRAGARIKTIKHAVTKYRIELHVHHAVLASRLLPPHPWRFISLDQMDDVPMSVTGRRICRWLRDQKQSTLSF